MQKNSQNYRLWSFGGKLTNWIIVILLTLIPPLSPGPILYLALRARNKKWLILFFITFFLYGFTLSFIINVEDSYTILYMLCALVLLGIPITNFVILIELNKFLYPKANDSIYQSGDIFEEVAAIVIPESKANVTVTGEQFIDKLNKILHEVEDDCLRDDIGQLIELSHIVAKRNDAQSAKFFINYNEKLVPLLIKYDEIENTRLQNPEILNTMKYIRDSVNQVVVAFRNEVASMYKHDLLDINANTAVFMQDLKSKGLIN